MTLADHLDRLDALSAAIRAGLEEDAIAWPRQQRVRVAVNEASRVMRRVVIESGMEVPEQSAGL